MSSALRGVTALLAAGGTGGHLQPALAVAAEVQARGARVVVRHHALPGRARRAPLYETYALELKGFERRVVARQHLTTLRLLAAAVPRARRILAEVRPGVVVGGGGFASGPVVALAATRRVPTLALEADAHLGVANRLLRPFVRRMCLSLPIAGLEPPKYVVTGRPLAAAQLTATAEEGRDASSSCGPTCRWCSSSAAARARRASIAPCVDAFGGRDLPFQLVHVCGPRNLDEVRAALERVRRAV